MSVLKSILHHWNSTSKAYDTLHPETEAAQVTDWHESIIGSLASKVLPTVVSELTTDSVMGKLIKMLLTASGVKYSIDTNGYVCLGSFFGGLIIQWINAANENQNVVPPLTGYTKLAEVATHRTGGSNYAPVAVVDKDGSTIKVVSNVSGGSASYWIGLFK